MDEIAQAPGIDGFYIGPSDLAVSMGLPPGSVQQDERHGAACQAVLDAARKAGLVAGIHCGSAAEAGERFRQGFQFAPIASDANIIAAGSKSALDFFKQTESVAGLY